MCDTHRVCVAADATNQPEGRHQGRDQSRHLSIRPLNDTYLVLEASQSRVALDTALRRTIGHRPSLHRSGLP
eukprot:6153319-Prymnesium_polylepis.2